MHHKHRPLKQEHQQQAESLSTKEGKAAFFKKRPKEEPNLQGWINTTQSQALQKVSHACRLIADSQPESAQLNQSKALELAQQYIDTEIKDIYYIQETLKAIQKTLYCQDQVQQTGLQKPSPKQFLHAAIALTTLPAREGLPGGGYEHTDPANVWTDYIYLLCQLLPDRPYLITGTPTSSPSLSAIRPTARRSTKTISTANKEKEEKNTARGPIRNFLSKLFRRHQNNS